MSAASPRNLDLSHHDSVGAGLACGLPQLEGTGVAAGCRLPVPVGSDSAGFGWDGFCRKWCDFGHVVIYSEDVAEIAPLTFGIGLTGFGPREDFGTNRCFSILREYQQLLSARNPREQSVLLYGLRRVGEQ